MLGIPWKNVPYVALDFETTGKRSERPGICEIGAVAIARGFVDRNRAWSRLINPEEPISIFSRRVHKINDDAVARMQTFGSVKNAFKVFMGDRIPVVHDAATEIDCLRKAGILPPLILDTSKLAHAVRGTQKGSALRTLVAEYNLMRFINRDYLPSIARRKTFHTGYFDALAAGHLFVYLIRKHKPNITLNELVELCGHKIEQNK